MFGEIPEYSRFVAALFNGRFRGKPELTVFPLILSLSPVILSSKLYIHSDANLSGRRRRSSYVNLHRHNQICYS